MNLFSIQVLGDDKLLTKGKPAPDPYLLASEKLNFAPKECWAVEDSFSGISSALKAGCCVFFLKEKDVELSEKDFFEKGNNLKTINYLKEIEQLLDAY